MDNLNDISDKVSHNKKADLKIWFDSFLAGLGKMEYTVQLTSNQIKPVQQSRHHCCNYLNWVRVWLDCLQINWKDFTLFLENQYWISRWNMFVLLPLLLCMAWWPSRIRFLSNLSPWLWNVWSFAEQAVIMKQP